MKPLEMSLLAAGALVALLGGGAAARLALAPLDEAYAKHQAIAADGAASSAPSVVLAAQSAPAIGAEDTAAPAPVGDATERRPPVVYVRDESAAVDPGPWAAPDRQDGPGRRGRRGPDADAADYSGYAGAGPEPVEMSDGEGPGPYPEDQYVMVNRGHSTRPLDGAMAEPRFHGPSEPY